MMVTKSTVIIVVLTHLLFLSLRYGILDALVTNIDGLTFDILACQYQEMLDNVTACQQDGDSNRNGLLDRNPFPLAATLASISDVLCMPRCALLD